MSQGVTEEGLVAAGRIRRLPPLVVNQIAAGEVIERPASVVKELVENALDARATLVVVELDQGGIELVRVSDDGLGMAPEDLPLAVAPHATSKIKSASDLDHVETMGFRGEALASIASVSRLSIRSRARGSESGAQIDVEGERAGAVRPASAPEGTAVTVRNLFFNTPARRRFLRTLATEQARCLDVVRDVAMSHPSIGFRATVDGRVVIDLPPGQSPRERALSILGQELEGELLEVTADQFDGAGGISLWGLVGKPSIARTTAREQRVFINGRAVRDRTIAHALREAYRGLIDPNRHPTAALMLEMDPRAVDVNVHPAKAEVRFRDSSLVHTVVLRAVREALASADLTALFSGGRRVGGRSEILPASAPSTATHPARSFVDYFTREIPIQTGGRLSYDALRAAMEGAREPANVEPEADGPPKATGEVEALPTVRPVERVLQVHNSYLVTQDEEGVVIVDQHALHERVMFEYLLARVTRGELERQRLLTPVVVDVRPEQAERLETVGGLLERLGIEASMIGPRSAAVQAFPTFLFEKGVDPGEFLLELLARAEEEGFAPDSEEALREVLDMMSCKAAVKAGDRLSDTELDALLSLREGVERSSNCPHGRPTSVRLTIAHLERLFGRS